MSAQDYPSITRDLTPRRAVNRRMDPERNYGLGPE